MKDAYEKYLSMWLQGLKDEVNFWNNYMQTEGGISFYGYFKTISAKRKFELENDIPIEKYGKEYKFIDVGAGPFSRCGIITDKVDLHAVSVDPLAYVYKELKKKYGIDNSIELENGFVELLSRKYESNTFDMVHMSNSLDHCFSAIDGIYQLLNICRIGGKVILRHAENEAVRENYQGLHQWNLSLHNDEESFIIWRENEKYDICKMFKEYADIELYKDVKEEGGHWKYNKVVMTKKKNIDIPDNSGYYEIMLDMIYRQYTQELIKLNSISCIIKDGYMDITERRINRIKKAWHDKQETQMILTRKNWKSFIIYGMGYVGTNLDYLLSELGIKPIRLDKKGKESLCFEAIKLEECNDFNVDVIIMTIDSDEVHKKLQKYKGENTALITIDEFLDSIQ